MALSRRWLGGRNSRRGGVVTSWDQTETAMVIPYRTFYRQGACPGTARGAVVATTRRGRMKWLSRITFFFCMVLFLCLDETLVALEKSANATFVLDGVEVRVEEIEPCWTSEQLRDWTIGVREAYVWRFVWSQKSPWVERRSEDLVFDFVIVTEERTLRSRGQWQEKKNGAQWGKNIDTT